MKIKKYDEFTMIKEEFVFDAIKGALSKLFQVFAQPFKDLANDFKKLFDPKDPNSCKNVVMDNFNQAIDGAQKEIQNVTDEGSLMNIFPQMVGSLIDLSQNLDKDIKTGLGEDKLLPVKKIAQVIILGSQEAGYAGIVGILDPNNEKQRQICQKLGFGDPTKIQTAFKFNRQAFKETLTKAGGNLDAQKKAANAFLDNLQKSIRAEIDKELTEEEINNIYNKAKAGADKEKGKKTVGLYWKSGGTEKEIQLEKVDKGWKITNSTSQQLVLPGNKEVFAKISGDAEKGRPIKLDGLNTDGAEFKTKKGENFYSTGNLTKIVMDGSEVNKYSFESAGGGKEELQTKLKDMDAKNFPRVGKFADFLKSASPDKIAQVQKLMSGEGQGGGQAGE